MVDAPTQSEDDAGVSTVLGALMVGLLIVVTGVCVRLGGAMLARQQAETSADLGALAGAAAVLQGSDAACGKAARVVVANRGRLISCSVAGLDVLVEAEVPVPTFGGTASARARAGPVSAP